MEKVVNNIIAGIFLFGLFGFGVAQETTPYLERKITLELNGTTIKETLKEMETQGEYLFAYRTDLIEGNQQLTRTYTNKTTRAVLNDLFAGKITYKERGKYIILREQSTSDEKTIQLSGYISNKASGETIPYATLYDSISLTSSSSNEYGYYTLTLKNSENPLIIIKKEGYRDTTIQWTQSGVAVYNIAMEALPVIEDSTHENIEETAKIKWFQRFMRNEEAKAKFENFKEKLTRKTQFSLVPDVGTNGKLNSKTTVDYSFNAIGGFTGGVRVMELGLLFNLDWDSVSYFQAAGLFNKVGGHQRGVQIAGITNINKSDVHGAQFTVITNITDGEVRGIQTAGMINFVNGFKGGQFAGLGNYSYKKSVGGQFAGIFNKSEGKLIGAQVAGIVNIAEDVVGAQIGLININKSIKGVPVGLFSFSRKGLHQVELSTSESFHLNLAFKTGVNQFYNSFLGGVRFQGKSQIFGLGYGIGTSVKTSDKTRLFFDAQAIALHRKGLQILPNGIGKFTLSSQWQISPIFAIAAGPSFNILVSNAIHTQAYSALVPYSVFSHIEGAYQLKTWVGGHLSLRFF